MLRHVAAAAERVVVQRRRRPASNDVRAELGEHAAHRLADRAEMRRVEAALRDHPAAPVEERAREVARLAEDRGVGGAHHVRAHLLRDLHELVADHADRHAGRPRAGRRRVPSPESRRIPSASTRSSWPGQDERRRVELLDDRRAAQHGAGRAAPRGGRPACARDAPPKRTSRTVARRRQRRPRAARPAPGRAPGPSAVTFGVDQLDRLAGEAVAVHLVVQLVERRERPLERAAVEPARRRAAPRARSSARRSAGSSVRSTAGSPAKPSAASAARASCSIASSRAASAATSTASERE